MMENGTFLSIGDQASSITTQSASTQASSMDLETNVGRIIYWEVALNYWKATSSYPGIIASGQPCSAQNPLKIVDPGVQEATWSCINNQLFYLVMPGMVDPCSGRSGEGEGFSDGCPMASYFAPDGISDLGAFNLTRDDFLVG